MRRVATSTIEKRSELMGQIKEIDHWLRKIERWQMTPGGHFTAPLERRRALLKAKLRSL